MFSSIRRQLTLMMCTLVLLALVSTFSINYLMIARDYEQSMQRDNSVLAESLAANIAQFMQNAYNVSHMLAEYPGLKDLSNAEQQAILVEMTQRYPIFQLLAINDLNGQQRVRSSGPLGNRAERWWFKKFMAERQPYISKMYYSASTDGPITTILHGIYADEKLVGLMMSDIEIRALQQMVENYNSGAGSYAYLLDGDGAVIAHPDKRQVAELYNYKTMKKRVLVRDAAGAVQKDDKNNEVTAEIDFNVAPSLQAIVNKAVAGEAGVGEYTDLGGERYICAYRTIPLPGVSDPWSLIVVQRKSAVMAFVNDVTLKNMLVGLLVVALSAFLAWWFSRKITTPLVALVQATNQVKDGDLSSQLMVQTSNELGALTANFNQMVSRLREHRDRLEELVEARTLALATVNQKLTVANQTLAEINQRLQQENQFRRQTEKKLLLRERQYRAITGLLTSASHETEDILASILHQAVQLLGADAGYIGVYENEGKIYRIKHSIGIDKPRLLDEATAQAGMQGEVYASGELFYVDDYRSYPGRIANPLVGASATTVIMVPLKQAGKVHGILAVNWVAEVHPVSNADLDALRQFGDLASVTLEQDTAQKQIAHIAFHDPLTGLANRASLNHYLEQQMRQAKCCGAKGVVLFIDMDDLKSVNDNFGHSSGDEVIVAAGQLISAAVGQHAFVSRQGGDEFIVVVPGDNSREQAGAFAEAVMQKLCQEYTVAGKTIHLSASIGVAVYPDDGDAAEDLLKKADNAMYAAKEAGRNCWRFYEPVLLQTAYEKMVLTNALRRGLERREFTLHYQPQFDAAGGRILGFEALLRWHSAEHGVVSPSKFIPLAEQSGLILPIGQWVLEEACRFARRLAEAGQAQIHVAVNVSTKQLIENGFVDNVRRAVADAGLVPSQLQLEITESVLMDSVEENAAKLKQLKALGVTLALDDFGTGYSSLTYLRNLPVTILKIDKTFVDKIIDDETQRQMIGAIVAMGHTLGLVVTAEGVETPAQAAVLQGFGCDLIQGFVFSRPLTEAAALARLSASTGAG